MAKKTDTQTLNLIKEVNKRKAEISKLEKPNYKTNLSFSYDERKPNDSINVHVEMSIKNLIDMAAFVKAKAVAYYDVASMVMEGTPPPFTWMNFTHEDWLDDIKTRINKLHITQKKKQLETLEARLNSIISPELRAQIVLDEITSELG